MVYGACSPVGAGNAIAEVSGPLDPAVVGLTLGPVTHEWSERDAVLYALGIGARLPDDLPYLFERHAPTGLAVMPTFALTAVTRMLPPLVEALAIDLPTARCSTGSRPGSRRRDGVPAARSAAAGRT